MVCHNPLLEEERGRKRQALLEATEKSLTKIAKDVARRKKKLLTAAEIGLKVGKVLGRYKVGKHFDCRIGEGSFIGAVARRPSIRKRSWTEFMCCAPVNPSSASRRKTPCATTRRLAEVERAFRCLKGDRSAGAAHSASHRRAGARAYFLMPARLLCGMAPAPGVGAAVVRG